MGIKFTQLQCKEVICVSDGARLGYIADIVAEGPQGVIAAIVVPGKPRLRGMAGHCAGGHPAPGLPGAPAKTQVSPVGTLL